MPIRDRNIGWKTCRMYIPVQSLSLDNDGTITKSLAQGTPSITPSTGTLEQVTIPLTTADEVEFGMPIPWNMDRDKKVLGRIFCTVASTDADADVDLIFTTLFFEKQATTAEVKGGADSTVEFTMPTFVVTDDSLEVSQWVDLEWDTSITADDIFVGVNLEMQDDGATTGDEVELLGIELMWEIKATDKQRRRTVRELDRNPT